MVPTPNLGSEGPLLALALEYEGGPVAAELEALLEGEEEEGGGEDADVGEDGHPARRPRHRPLQSPQRVLPHVVPCPTHTASQTA